MKRKLASLAALVLLLQAARCVAAGDLPAASADPREIIHSAVENDIRNDKEARNYTYTEREQENKLDSSGAVKSSESTTYESLVLYEVPMRRMVARNDQPLPAKDAAKEEERISKFMREHANETAEQKQKRLAQYEKDRNEERAWVHEINEAFNFQMLPEEALNGRAAFVIDATPRAGFQPHLKDAKYLTKFRFRVWIDKAESQWVKLDAETIDNVSWGWFVARLQKGSHLLLQQTRVNDEVWLPQQQQFKVAARVMLFKKFNEEVDTTFKDYKKFRAETRILSADAVK